MAEPASFPPRPDARRAAALRRRIRAWYAANRRDLPWRNSRDPYAIWVSEAMLQQTRVGTAIPYWRRFLERFPTAAELARAPEEEVLAAWSGLGYYRRALALQRAARRIEEQHGGRFPRDADAARSLPGVGPYTAGAVLSIAYDLPEAAVDGNVARLFCRLFALDADPASRELREELWALAEQMVPRRGAGDWNQALMELGATVCLPREPRCEGCPLSGPCAARSERRTAELPRARKRAGAVDVRLTLVAAARKDALLLERRPEIGRMAGLWQLPTVEEPGRDGGRTGLFPAELPRRRGGRPLVEVSERVGEIRHSITHHRIRGAVHRGRVVGRGALPAGLAWLGGRELARAPLTGMTRKALGVARSPARGYPPTLPSAARP